MSKCMTLAHRKYAILNAKKINMFFNCNHGSTKSWWKPLFLSLGLTRHSLRNSQGKYAQLGFPFVSLSGKFQPRIARGSGLPTVCTCSPRQSQVRFVILTTHVYLHGAMQRPVTVLKYRCAKNVIILSGDIQLIIISSRRMTHHFK